VKKHSFSVLQALGIVVFGTAAAVLGVAQAEDELFMSLVAPTAHHPSVIAPPSSPGRKGCVHRALADSTRAFGSQRFNCRSPIRAQGAKGEAYEASQ
jgi:hypothetical protein